MSADGDAHPSNPFSNYQLDSTADDSAYCNGNASSDASSDGISNFIASPRRTSLQAFFPPAASAPPQNGISNGNGNGLANGSANGNSHSDGYGAEIENGNVNGNASHSTVNHTEGMLSSDHSHDEEIYFDGLTYPVAALDWCSTNGAELVDEYATSARAAPSMPSAPQSERVCVADFSIPVRVEQSFVNTFRMSSPYIHAHQGLIFVIHIPGNIIHEPLFASVMEDIALMRVVGIKLILVLGPHDLVTKRLREEGTSYHHIDGIRVTDASTFRIVKELAGSMRFEVECALAKGVTNMPSKGPISVVSGNFFSAQPVGIIDGKDFGYTGKVRRIDVDAIKRRLADGDILLLSNVGSSPSGQQFNCKGEEVAAECAAAMKAEKLIFLGDGETLYDRRNDRAIPNLALKTAARFLNARAAELPFEFRLALKCSVSALERGVRRAHILNRHMNGVMLMEVFHRDGVGLMISRDLYEGFRPAKTKDVNGVKQIIGPLEDQGILKKRSRTMLERDIDKFVVIERDGMIIACLSLTIMKDEPTWAELGCVAVHKDYRKLGKGDAMLGFTERMAFDKGVRNLFVLSTQSFDWFYERGFKEVSINDLPKSRQEMYDHNRRSKIFYKVLHGSRAVSLSISIIFFVFFLHGKSENAFPLLSYRLTDVILYLHGSESFQILRSMRLRS